MSSSTLTDYAVAVATIGLGGVYLYETHRLPELINVDPLGPKAFPTLIGLLVLGCGVGIAVAARANASNRDEKSEDRVIYRDSRLRAVVATAAAIFVYAYLLEPVGFLISSFIFLAGFMFCLGAARPLYILPVSLCFPLFIAALMTALLGYQPAAGLFGF